MAVDLEILTKKVGPLPIWGYGLAIGGGVVAAKFLSGRGSGGQTVVGDAAAPNGDAQLGQPSSGGTGSNGIPSSPGSGLSSADTALFGQLSTAVGNLTKSNTQLSKDLAAQQAVNAKQQTALDKLIKPVTGATCGPKPLYAQPAGTQRVCVPGVGWRDVPIPGWVKPKPAPTPVPGVTPTPKPSPVIKPPIRVKPPTATPSPTGHPINHGAIVSAAAHARNLARKRAQEAAKARARLMRDREKAGQRTRHPAPKTGAKRPSETVHRVGTHAAGSNVALGAAAGRSAAIGIRPPAVNPISATRPRAL